MESHFFATWFNYIFRIGISQQGSTTRGYGYLPWAGWALAYSGPYTDDGILKNGFLGSLTDAASMGKNVGQAPHIFFCKSSVLIPCSKHNFQDSHGNYIRKSNYPEVIGDDRWNATSKCQSKLGRPTLMYPVKSKVVMSGVQRETKEDLS